MATLALAAAGAAVGSALLPAGISFLGATLTGAAVGSQIGALAGGFVDQALFGSSGRARAFAGPRLGDLHVTGSSEGAPVPRVYGRARIGGQVIWATRLEEDVVVTEEGGGGKGGLGGGGGVTGTEYRYFANFAVALCEGPISGIGRIWADGNELEAAGLVMRVHPGDLDQAPDPLIVAKEGADHAPAYRGTAYVVFERLALARFGNRLPQLSFEVFRSVDSFERQIRSVVLIPGAGEFVYEPREVARVLGAGTTESENVHTSYGVSDWSASIDQLTQALASVRHVSLFVSWFGDDLRANHCQVRPAVDSADKTTTPVAWSVAGLTRAAAAEVSRRDGRPAYGGTPSDASVVAAIRDLGVHGLAVTLTPFLLMDIAADNALPDPYSSGSSQPAYPWRGRITVSPAPGRPGTPDKTPAAASQVAQFLGTAQVSDFALDGDAVVYSGPAEWSYRRMVLHYAHLAKAAGGVDAFLIGSELRGLTWVRSGPATYPFVAGLAALAADVRTVLGPSTKISYAADWSEYFGHQPADGSGDVHFHLDPLWASPAIDAVAIDVYWPLADWRAGRGHADWIAGHRSQHDLAYLKSGILGGEGFEWYYASDADRAAQVRTPITDGAGKPWVFRFKDIRSWWSSPHYDRPGGIEQAAPTPWVPASKPIWFTELGCPAIDKGANQPNVFYDPKSSESALPYASTGARDDLAQRRYLQALIEAFDPDHDGYLDGANPLSPVYAGRMVELDRVSVYAWDARPYPAFPSMTGVWGDGASWQRGHWLNGRISAAPLDRLVAAILADHGFDAYDVSGLRGTVAGYVVDRILSARETLQPLELSHFVDTFESQGLIRFVHRGALPEVATLGSDDLVETKPAARRLELTRRQETELPAVAKLSYLSAEADYHQSIAEGRRRTASSRRVATGALPIVLEQPRAQALSEAWLYEAWAAREQATFAVPPSRLALDPSDAVILDVGSEQRLLRLTEIADTGHREVTSLSLEPEIYDIVDGPIRPVSSLPRIVPTVPVMAFLDLPALNSAANEHAGHVAAFHRPWLGAVSVYRSPDVSGYSLNTQLSAPATMGELLAPLDAGPIGRWDHANAILVRLYAGTLASRADPGVLEGGNLAAIQSGPNLWEVVQFGAAELIGERTYRLTRLLRAQGGTEDAMPGLTAGARFVLLDAAVRQTAMSRNDVGRSFSWAFGPATAPIGGQGYGFASLAFGGRGLRPLSPVHVRGRRQGGDLVLTWTRRTRTGGDSWEAAEVPLAEDVEGYEVDILPAAGSPLGVRTLATTTPSAVYDLTAQVADWGSAQPSYWVRVHQLSASLGRGIGREALIQA